MAPRELARAADTRRATRRLRLTALAALGLGWELLAANDSAGTGVAPSLVAIGGALVHLLGSARFWSNLSITGAEIGLAILIGGVFGIVAGILIGRSRLAAAALEPIVNALAATPKVVFLPILYLLFGIGIGSKVAVGAIACALPMIIGVTTAVLELNPVLAKVGRSFGISARRALTSIYLPALREPIVNTLRLAAGAAIAVCLIAEIRFSFGGLGFMVIDAFNRARFAEVYAMLAIIIGLALVFDALLSRISGRRRA